MNDFLRILQKSLRPFGYDIRRRGSFNLLPAKGVAETLAIPLVQNCFNDDCPPASSPAALDRLKIVYRTALTGARIARGTGRPGDLSLDQMVERCFSSLVASVNDALSQAPHFQIEIVLLDDHSEQPYLDRLRGLASSLACPWILQTTSSTGQGASLYEQFSMARADDALYYFCEDDYLHEKSAIFEMMDFYAMIHAKTGRHLVIHPQEQPSLYAGSYFPAYLFLSPHRHWRSIDNATHCLFLHAHVVRDFWAFFENTKYVGDKRRRHLGSERRTTNRIFEQIPAFAPLPALAAHMQSEATLPPLFDWRSLWTENFPPPPVAG